MAQYIEPMGLRTVINPVIIWQIFFLAKHITRLVFNS